MKRCWVWVLASCAMLTGCLMVPLLLLGAAPHPTVAAGEPETVTFEATRVVTEGVATMQRLDARMNSRRFGHAATLLPDGRVLITGGQLWMEELSSAEIFDPATESFSPLPTEMAYARVRHEAILMPNGKVLIVGGVVSQTPVPAELYDPATGAFTLTGTPAHAYSYWTTVLPSGEILVIGEASPERYDPATGLFSPVGTPLPHSNSVPVLLADGKVLLTGGRDGSTYVKQADIFDPLTGEIEPVYDMIGARFRHAATLLPDGKVLIVGGDDHNVFTNTLELYDPQTRRFTPAGTLTYARSGNAIRVSERKVLILGDTNAALEPTELYDIATGQLMLSYGSVNAWGAATTLLRDGQILISGGGAPRGPLSYDSAILTRATHANTLTGSLTLPSGWQNSQTISVTVRGEGGPLPVEAALLTNEEAPTWESWIPIADGVPTTVSWNVGGDGTEKPLHLYVRDVDGQVMRAVTGYVNVDTLPPTSTVRALAPISPGRFIVSWEGVDAGSGIDAFYVEMSEEGGPWRPLTLWTTETGAVLEGTHLHHYAFRVRARDVQGRTEDWPATPDAETQVDALAPEGMVEIVSVGPRTAELVIDAPDQPAGTTQMRVERSPLFAHTPWGAYSTTKTLDFGGPSDEQFLVYAQFRDAVGNTTPILCFSYGGAVCPALPHELFLPLAIRAP